MFPGISTNVNLATSSNAGLVLVDSSLNIVSGVLSSRTGRADNWVLSNNYKQGESVIYTDGKLYIANTAITSSTPFSVGSSGKTWTLIGPSALSQTSATKTSATYVISLTDFMIRGNSSTQSQVFTLPTSASAYSNNIGQIFHIKKIDSSTNTVTLQASGTELIDGYTTRPPLSSQYSSWAVMANGTGWDVL